MLLIPTIKIFKQDQNDRWILFFPDTVCFAILWNRGTMEIISPKMDLAFLELIEDDEVRRYFISDVLDISVEQIKETRLGNRFCGDVSIK